MASNTWYSNNSSGNGYSPSSNSNGGFSNRGWMQEDSNSNRSFKSGSYQQHNFIQSGSSSSSIGRSGFAFAQPMTPKTEAEKRKAKNDAVKKHREFKETVKFLENEELKDKENQLRNLKREKSEVIGEIRGLSKVFSTIAINNPTYMDEEFHRIRKALFNVANNAEKFT